METSLTGPSSLQAQCPLTRGVTNAHGVGITFAAMILLYAALGAALIVTLRAMSRRWRDEGEGAVEVPYGPDARLPRSRFGGARVSRADAVAVVLFIGVTMYAVFGGADFGAGLWSLLAGGGEPGRRPRQMIDSAIGPVWEANHVWLIFVLVVLWTGFSSAFEAIFSTLFIPLSLAAVGIVLRGAGFAFHHTARTARGRDAAQLLFGLSSILTPFFMGTVVGAIVGERVPVGNAAGDSVTSWLNPLSIVIGFLFVSTSAYLAAVFLVNESRRTQGPGSRAVLRCPRNRCRIVAGALAVVGLIVMRSKAPFVYDGLTGDALPLVIVSLVCGVAVFVLLTGTPAAVPARSRSERSPP